ncbi:MAG: hypothetical protein HY319_12765 [Armatimonadetes bacterium]|nr:hypothetical protein [Armatimonadota bacterium]
MRMEPTYLARLGAFANGVRSEYTAVTQIAEDPTQFIQDRNLSDPSAREMVVDVHDVLVLHVDPSARSYALAEFAETVSRQAIFAALPAGATAVPLEMGLKGA